MMNVIKELITDKVLSFISPQSGMLDVDGLVEWIMSFFYNNKK